MIECLFKVSCNALLVLTAEQELEVGVRCLLRLRRGPVHQLARLRERLLLLWGLFVRRLSVEGEQTLDLEVRRLGEALVGFVEQLDAFLESHLEIAGLFWLALCRLLIRFHNYYN